MKFRKLLFALFTLLLLGCKEEIEPALEPKELEVATDSVMKVVWKIPKEASMDYGAGFCGFYNSVVAFAVSGKNGAESNLIGMDTRTGKELWRLKQIRFNYSVRIYQVNNLLIFSLRKIVYAVNIIDGTIAWETKCPYNNISYFGDGDLYLSAGKLWKDWSCGNGSTDDSTVLFSIDPLNGGLKRITAWNHAENESYMFSFSRPDIWMAPNSDKFQKNGQAGDSILVLNSISMHQTNYSTKTDFIAWNLNKNKAYFDYRGYKRNNHLFNPIVVENDVILFDGWRNLESFNLVDLKTNWNLDLTSNRSSVQITYHDGKLITSPNGREDNIYTTNASISYISPESGNILNSTTIEKADCYQLFFKNNWMYYLGSHNIWKVNLTNLKKHWKFESPENIPFNNGFNGEMAFDSDNDLIYVAGSYFFYCFKIVK